jgi:hypothetical protein
MAKSCLIARGLHHEKLGNDVLKLEAGILEHALIISVHPAKRLASASEYP